MSDIYKKTERRHKNTTLLHRTIFGLGMIGAVIGGAKGYDKASVTTELEKPKPGVVIALGAVPLVDIGSRVRRQSKTNQKTGSGYSVITRSIFDAIGTASATAGGFILGSANSEKILPLTSDQHPVSMSTKLGIGAVGVAIGGIHILIDGVIHNRNIETVATAKYNADLMESASRPYNGGMSYSPDTLRKA